jgi:hypothetical protein
MLYSHPLQTYCAHIIISQIFRCQNILFQIRDNPKSGFEPRSRGNRKYGSGKLDATKLDLEGPTKGYKPFGDKMKDKALSFTEVSGLQPNRLAGLEA